MIIIKNKQTKNLKYRDSKIFHWNTEAVKRRLSFDLFVLLKHSKSWNIDSHHIKPHFRQNALGNIRTSPHISIKMCRKAENTVMKLAKIVFKKSLYWQILIVTEHQRKHSEGLRKCCWGGFFFSLNSHYCRTYKKRFHKLRENYFSYCPFFLWNTGLSKRNTWHTCSYLKPPPDGFLLYLCNWTTVTGRLHDYCIYQAILHTSNCHC